MILSLIASYYVDNLLMNLSYVRWPVLVSKNLNLGVENEDLRLFIILNKYYY